MHRLLISIFILFGASVISARLDTTTVRPTQMYRRSDFLRMKCRRGPSLVTLSPVCQRFFQTRSTPTTTIPTSALPLSTTTTTQPPVPHATLQGWAKVLIAIISSLAALYSAYVSFLKFRLKKDLKTSLLLGCGPRGRSFQTAAPELPVPLV